MCVQGPERRVAFFTGTLTLTLLLCDACDFTCDLHECTHLERLGAGCTQRIRLTLTLTQQP